MKVGCSVGLDVVKVREVGGVGELELVVLERTAPLPMLILQS